MYKKKQKPNLPSHDSLATLKYSLCRHSFTSYICLIRHKGKTSDIHSDIKTVPFGYYIIGSNNDMIYILIIQHHKLMHHIIRRYLFIMSSLILQMITVTLIQLNDSLSYTIQHKLTALWQCYTGLAFIFQCDNLISFLPLLQNILRAI